MKNLFHFKLLILLLSFSFSLSLQANDRVLEQNKKVVREFYTLAFNQHQPAEAMKRYVGKSYKQHNPFAADGKEAFIQFFTEYFKGHPDVRVEIKRMIAESDLVLVHVHSQQNASDRGRAVMDIFRVQDGKIVEHWDVAQEIPEKQAHQNTMF